ncbi:MAG TPA: MFS transporter [Chitinophagaceae bacterium]|jgi:ACS family D-galactonate transporter-like MFS transporter|nr:MFS transporter [Chitinophagaceae bacterium]
MDQNKKKRKTGRVRYQMLLLVFVCVVVNYMDRSNISIAAPAILKDFHLTSVQLGLIFSAFGWTYTFFQIPGGFLLDRIGSRILYTFSLSLWSLATLLQGVATGFAGLFGLRLSIGVFEAPAFPINNRIATNWFPEKERASAIGIYTSGEFVGLAFLTPLLATLQHFWGWKGLFIITGIAGLIWSVIWYKLYRDPDKHPRLTKNEYDYIGRGGGLVKGDKASGKRAQWKDLKEVFRYKKLWGIYIGQFAVNSTLWFFLTWFPTYLIKYRHLDFLQSGFLASIPFLAAFAGILLSGFLSDLLLRKGSSVSKARKIPVILGLFLSTLIIGANYVNSTTLIVFFLAIAFFGNGVASITWVFVSTLAPPHLIGSTGGVFNFIGNLASVIVPVVIGFLVQGGNFEPALLFIGAMTLIGIFAYIFLVGKVERIQVKNAIPEVTENPVSNNN